MIEPLKPLQSLRELPLHWLLLVGLLVFLGCKKACEDDPNCTPAIFNANNAGDPPTAEDYVITACPGPPGCFDVSSWSGFVEAEEICDVSYQYLPEQEDFLICAAGIDAATGRVTLWCWLESTGEIVTTKDLGEAPASGCDNVKLAITDVNVDNLADICVAVNGLLVCTAQESSAGTVEYGDTWVARVLDGEPLDVEGGFCDEYGAIQSLSDESIEFMKFDVPGYGPLDGPVLPINILAAPPDHTFIDGVEADFNQDGYPDFLAMYSESTAGTVKVVVSFGGPDWAGAATCGGAFIQIDLAEGVRVWRHQPGAAPGLVIIGSSATPGPRQALFAEGFTDNPDSACPGGWGVGNDLILTLPVAGEVSDLVVSEPNEDGTVTVYITLPNLDRLEIFTITRSTSPPPSSTELDSTAATTPDISRDPMGPYPTGGEPTHIVLGRDVNLDGKPEVLTVNKTPGNYSLVFSSVNNTEPNPIRLDGRVIADEPWLNNENAMPVGLISDLMVVGIPKDTEGAGTSTGAVWSFKRRSGRWVQHQKIIPENPQSGMRFGYSLSVEEQIDTGEAWLAIGSRTWNSFEGRVDLYKRAGDDWVYHQTLENGENDFFGWDVDINVDIPVGQEDPEWTVAIGAPSYRFDGRSSNTGAVFVSFMGSGTSFFTGPALPVNSESVTANNPGVGRSVAIDGDVIIAGAPGLRVDNNNGAGGVYIYRRGAFTPWALSSEILNPNPATGEINGANFGFSVDVVKQVVYPRAPTGNYYYLIGAPRNTSLHQGGEAYIFGGGNSGYQRFRRPGGGDPNDKFGHAVAFRDDLIGGNHLFLVSTNFLKTGGAYLYDQPDFPDPWRPINTIDIPNRDQAPANTAVIGEAVAAWDDWVAVSTSNLSTGNDAIYTDLVPIMLSGFESGEVDKDIE